jgi:RimJ/RimL family protein N-acetyltransferase
MAPASTDRLLIRPFRPSDVDSAWGISEDPEVTRFLSWERPPLEEYRSLFLARMQAWAAYPKGSGVWAMLERELGRMAG